MLIRCLEESVCYIACVQVLPVSLLLPSLSFVSLLSTARQRGIFPMLHYFNSYISDNTHSKYESSGERSWRLALEVIVVKVKFNNLTTFVNFNASPLAERSATHPSRLVRPFDSARDIENFFESFLHFRRPFVWKFTSLGNEISMSQ